MFVISIPREYLDDRYLFADLFSSDDEPIVNRHRAFAVTCHNDRGIKFERRLCWNVTSAGVRIPIPGFLLKEKFCNSGYLYYCIARDGKCGFIFKEKTNVEEERNMNEFVNRINFAPGTITHIFDVLKITDIIFNDPATIVFWNDGTKTVVKTMDGDKFDPYVGVAIAVAKKYFGSNSAFKKLVHSYMKEEEE